MGKKGKKGGDEPPSVREMVALFAEQYRSGTRTARALPAPRCEAPRAQCARCGGTVARRPARARRKTDATLKRCDAVVALCAALALGQFLYRRVAGVPPESFHSYVAGMFSAIGTAVLTVSLRMQLDPANGALFPGLSRQSAVRQYLFAVVLLHVPVTMYLRRA